MKLLKKYIFLGLFAIVAFNNAFLISFSYNARNAYSSKKLTSPHRQKLFSEIDANFHEQSLQKFSNFYDWKFFCDQLSKFNVKDKNTYKTPLNTSIFTQEIDQFLMTMEKQLHKVFWLDGVQPSMSCDDFQAYVEKLIIPNKSVVAIHGDIHGDVHSINRFIEICADKGFLNKNNPFKIKNKNFYILFLGDYVDRGWYGAEVIYTILRLKNENPHNVFMVRGNHEDLNLNNNYGFSNELFKKFADDSLPSKINRLYNALPIALYLGAGKKNAYNIIQCCHGGIEIGFNPIALLENTHLHAGITISHLKQHDEYEHTCCSELNSFEKYFHDKSISSINGFMWNDFIVNPEVNFALSPRDGYSGEIFEYGQLVTKHLLKAWSGKSYQLRSVFRAHQHGDYAMKNRILNNDILSHPADAGVGKLWIENSIHQNTPGLLNDVAVITFSIAPHTGYGWPMHSFALLKVATNYGDWRLEVVNEPSL